MDRRSALSQIGLLSSALLVFNACFTKNEKEIQEVYASLGITDDEIQIVQKLCEVLIPSDNQIKGAKDLEIEKFVLLMVNDCLPSDDQKAYVNGLRSFQKEVLAKIPDKETLENVIMNSLSSKEDDTPHSFKSFLKITKDFTIQGFLTSRYFMTEIMPYEMIPGGFQGKVKIREGDKPNIYG